MKKNICFAAMLSALLSVGCKEAPQTQQAVPYASMTLTTSDAEIETQFSASIRGRQDIQIMPQVGGTISKVCVTEGQEVRNGQTLFVIDQVPYRAALRTAEANVQAAEAGVATAQLTYESKQELFAKNVVSEYDLRLAENQLLTAKAALAQAEAQEVNARNSLSYTVVKAPANGVVGTIPYRVGALVGPTMPQPLTTVSDNSQMYVYFSMNETALLNMARNLGSMEKVLQTLPKPLLQLSDGSIYSEPGVIESISGVIDPSTGSISVRAVFPNPGRLLHSGGSGNIVLRHLNKNCIVIPCIATFELQDKVYVYAVEEGKATSKMIEVIKLDGKSYIVKSGLKPGEVILTEGVAMMREGTPVLLESEAAAAPEAPAEPAAAASENNQSNE
ncbi:MAG: efflux RND transporter periplasmic adaptor subunit [Rikenellaceae bacterium]|nr:efflux RND transporter periplasmic adaptor subunit [Rikenellaceae bacterium]